VDALRWFCRLRRVDSGRFRGMFNLLIRFANYQFAMHK
jgi:hypothetical protein